MTKEELGWGNEMDRYLKKPSQTTEKIEKEINKDLFKNKKEIKNENKRLFNEWNKTEGKKHGVKIVRSFPYNFLLACFIFFIIIIAFFSVSFLILGLNDKFMGVFSLNNTIFNPTNINITNIIPQQNQQINNNINVTVNIPDNIKVNILNNT